MTEAPLWNVIVVRDGKISLFKFYNEGGADNFISIMADDHEDFYTIKFLDQ